MFTFTGYSTREDHPSPRPLPPDPPSQKKKIIKKPTGPSSRPIRSGLSHRKVGSPPGQLPGNQSQMFSPSGTVRRTTQGVPPCSPRHPGPSLNPRSGFITLRLCHRMNNWTTSGKTRHVVLSQRPATTTSDIPPVRGFQTIHILYVRKILGTCVKKNKKKLVKVKVLCQLLYSKYIF